MTKDKVRAAIKTKARSLNLFFDNSIGRYFMENDGPWEYLWAKADNAMHSINEESRKTLEIKVWHASELSETPRQIPSNGIVTLKDRTKKQQGNSKSAELVLISGSQ